MTKLTDTFYVSFFPCKDSTINTRCSILNTPLSQTDDVTCDTITLPAGRCLSALMTHSAIRRLRQPSVMRQNNHQRTVTSQVPRSQFLLILSLGKPKGKRLQE
jgi:hypothetical protein